MNVKVRAFPQTLVELGPEEPVLAVSGMIRSGGYVLVLGSAEIPVPTLQIGSDADGSYAVLEEGRSTMAGGTVLEILAEDGTQAELSLWTIAPQLAELSQGSPKFLAPKSSSITINFRPDGSKEQVSALQRHREGSTRSH